MPKHTFAINQLYRTPAGQIVRIQALVCDRVIYTTYGGVLPEQGTPCEIFAANTSQWVIFDFSSAYVMPHQNLFARCWSTQWNHLPGLYVDHYFCLKMSWDGFVTCLKYTYRVDFSNTEIPLGDFAYTETTVRIPLSQWRNMLSKPLQVHHYEMGQVYRNKVTGYTAEIYAKVFDTLFVYFEDKCLPEEISHLPGNPDNWDLVTSPLSEPTPTTEDLYNNPRPNQYVRWLWKYNAFVCEHRVVLANVGGKVTFLQYRYSVDTNSERPIGRFGRSEECYTVSLEAWRETLRFNIPELRDIELKSRVDKNECCVGDTSVAMRCPQRCFSESFCQA